MLCDRTFGRSGLHSCIDCRLVKRMHDLHFWFRCAEEAMKDVAVLTLVTEMSPSARAEQNSLLPLLATAVPQSKIFRRPRRSHDANVKSPKIKVEDCRPA